MRVRELITEDDALTPVVGIALLVAITVILAATVATFVLGFGDQSEPAPTVDMNFDYDSSTTTVTVTHGDGEELSVSNVYIRGENVTPSGSLDTSPWSLSGTFSAGQSIDVNVGGDDYVLNVVWEDPDSDSTSTLSTDIGPEA